MDNIFIVTDAKDYHTVCMFSTRELAEAYIKNVTGKDPYSCGGYAIEEWSVDHEHTMRIAEGKPTLWCGLVDKEKYEVEGLMPASEGDWVTSSYEIVERSRSNKYRFGVTVLASGREEAIQLIEDKVKRIKRVFRL